MFTRSLSDYLLYLNLNMGRIKHLLLERIEMILMLYFIILLEWHRGQRSDIPQKKILLVLILMSHMFQVCSLFS